MRCLRFNHHRRFALFSNGCALRDDFRIRCVASSYMRGTYKLHNCSLQLQRDRYKGVIIIYSTRIHLPLHISIVMRWLCANSRRFFFLECIPRFSYATTDRRRAMGQHVDSFWIQICVRIKRLLDATSQEPHHSFNFSKIFELVNPGDGINR